MKNLITDVPGLSVGNAEDHDAKSGVTVMVCDEPSTASGFVMGGAPGTRDTDMLSPEQTVEAVDAIVLSGGSAFGLDAAGGVMSALAAEGRGFTIGPARVPIVPQAILFDLLNGGDKSGISSGLYRELAERACAATAEDFALGSVGAGTGATTASLKGGLGSASATLESGHVVGALVATNALGSVTVGDTPHFWAAPHEAGSEFGGIGLPAPLPRNATELRHKLQATERQNTTLAIVATNAPLTKPQARRISIAAHDGFARAIWPAHTPFDGDIVFTVSTGNGDEVADTIELGAVAAACVARAIARGIYEATPADGDPMPCWQQKFGTHAQ